ncbi:MAG: hypothetical protein Q8T09_13745 [Candidatus Melainabacteria bacterium]|nr:hypothetical protein [Candidatus Melainabacteria bacterium]
MQTEMQTNYRFVSTSNDGNLPINSTGATGETELPTIAVGVSAIANCLGVGELADAGRTACPAVAVGACSTVTTATMSRYVDGRIDSFEEATILRHNQALVDLPKMVREASDRGESTIVIDCRAYYRNFSYPQLNYPSASEVLRVVAAIEAQGFTAVLEPVNQGRGRCEENSHSALYQLKACFTKLDSH